MRPIILSLITSIIFPIFSFSQIIATWNGSSFQINLNSTQKNQIFDSLKYYSGYNGSLKSFAIDDPEPTNSASIAYLVINGENKSLGTYVAAHFYLLKEINGNTVNYTLNENSREDVGGSCTGVNCSECKGHRNWFLGPIVSCTCEQGAGGTGASYCNHSTSDSIPWWFPIVQIIIQILLAL